MATQASVEIEHSVLTEEEAYAALDEQARLLLNMTADEFLQRWRRGAFAEELEGKNHSALVYLSLMAAPFGP